MHIVVETPATQTSPPVSFQLAGTYIPEALIAFIKALYPGHVFVKDKYGDLVILKDIEGNTEVLPPHENLKIMRIKAGLSQTQLAERVGTGLQYYNILETGKQQISRKMAGKLAKALGTSYTMFFY